MANVNEIRALATLMLIIMFIGLSACSGDTVTLDNSEGVSEKHHGAAQFITLTTGVAISDVIASDFSEAKWENSVWMQAYRQELGIDVKAAWYTKGMEAARQKVSVAIASGKIPDVIAVNQEQLSALSKTGLYTDLTNIFEQYASPLTKSIILGDDLRGLESATFDGKLIAIPGLNSAIDGASFLWLRKDWLDQLGLQVPSTTAELYDVIRAFTLQDPDGNGKQDTVGLSLSNSFLNMGLAEAIGIFNAFDAYPKIWIEGKDGKLVYGSVQPEVKPALAFLNKLFEEGLMEMDFAAKDTGRAGELVASGKVGIMFGAMWNGMYPMQLTKDNDADSNWRAFPIVSMNEQPAHPQVKLNVENYYVVRSGYAHPEALLKLINFWTELNYGDTSQARFDHFLGPLPAPGHHYAVAKVWKVEKNLQAHLKIMEVFKTGERSMLNAEEKGYYDNILKYQGGENAYAQYEKVFGSTGSYAVMNDYKERNLFKMDEFYGASTNAMNTLLITVDQLVEEYYTKVIMGVESIDGFDSFIAKLNKIGLEDVTREVNEWKSQKR
ncbi:extracellular solute-binding protein [Paenibacillus sinopodophylli]|uniref:extracellular solute-binding protein n=1 Tax=Paenibacillus sinopodophylli TaxID=1837342 RepID=UPI00110CD671|nr:extracellular solute-binding protein [Paenibacillus sinopodophylli]